MAQLNHLPTSELIEIARQYLNGWSGLALPDDIATEALNRLCCTIEKLSQAIKERDELQRKVEALAVENAALSETNDNRRTFIMNGVQLGYIKVPAVETDPALEVIRLAVSPQEPTPATDAALAKVRGRAQLDLCEYLSEIFRSIERKGGEFSSGAAGALAVVDSRVSWIEMVMANEQ